MKTWHDKTFSEVENILNANVTSGLSRKEAKKRLCENGPNNVFRTVRGDFLFYAKGIASDLIGVLFFIFSIIAYIFGSRSGIVLMIFIFLTVNAAVIASYVRSRRIIEDIEEFSVPMAKVMRENKIFDINIKEVVAGDVIVLSKGDIVPCDARIIWERDLLVRESGIAAKGSVKKDPAYIAPASAPFSECKNMLFAATVIERGSAYALACATGDDTLVSMTKKKKKKNRFEKAGIIISLKKLSKTLSPVMITFLAAISAFCLVPFYKGNTIDGILLSISVSSSALCGLLYYFGTVITAGGIYGTVYGFSSKSKKSERCIIKNPASIDKLAGADVIIIPPEALYDESAVRVKSIYSKDKEHKFDKDDKFSVNLLEFASVASGMFGTSRLALSSSSNALSYEEEAILKACGKVGSYSKILDSKYTLLDHKDFKKKNIKATLALSSGSYIYVKGSPDDVIDLCGYVYDSNKLVKIDDRSKEGLIALSNALGKGDSFVRAVAFKRFDSSTLLSENDCTGLVFQGFICFSLPCAKEVSYLAKRSKESGVRTIVFSSGGKETLELMKACGIADGDSKCISSEELSKMNDEMLITNNELYSLFYHLDESDKLRIIKCMKAGKEKVAFMGSSLNDIVLMKSSDVSFTCASTEIIKSGETPSRKKGKRDSCDALVFCADVLVPPVGASGGGYKSMIEANERAKCIHSNILKMIRFLLTSVSARIVVYLYTLFSGKSLITPLQVVILGFVFDVVAIMTFAFANSKSRNEEKPNENEVRKPLSHNYKYAIIGAVFGFLLILSSLFTGALDKGASLSSGCFFSLLSIYPFILYEVTYGKKKGSSKLSMAFCLACALAILFILLSLSTSLGLSVGLAKVSLIQLLETIIQAIFVFLFFEFFI